MYARTKEPWTRISLLDTSQKAVVRKFEPGGTRAVGQWTLHDSESRCAIIGAVSRKGAGRIASDKGGVQGRNSIQGFCPFTAYGNEHRAGMNLRFSPVLIESQKRQNVLEKHNFTVEERHDRGDCHDQR
jgi:hypothetical protein